ncbi:MAG: hypothetical protein KAX09_08060 [Candidatus Heimdallarchaeota archaeon]|nr:hypothetical protein [Candidatus Heimdallarchaeota archaeon]MCK4290923.1 hypothetical protein [Candidatus Heimdallarchaeota archaeon]
MTFSEQDSTGVSLGENFADLLTRVDKLSLEKVVETAAKYDCSQEFAGIVYLLNNDLGIEPILILDDLNNEITRLEKAGKSVPQVETDLYNFSINEGKWIAFLRGTMMNNLLEDIKNLQSYLSRLGRLKGSDLITLATQIMMERQFVAANMIIPVLEKWCEEHEASNELEAALRIYASIIGEPVSSNIIKEMNDAKVELVKQIEVLGDILSNAEESTWIIRSLIEAEILYEDLSQELSEMTSKGISDIILWLLIQKYGKKIAEFKAEQDISKLIMRFQLESALGLSNATPQAKLEYGLLTLNYKDKLAKKKLGEQLIFDAWKEARLNNQPLNVGREILAMLIDYSNLTQEFLSKIPRHFEYVTTYFKSDKLRLQRALGRFKIKGSKPTDMEMQESVILDYLIQFVLNYISGKMKADPHELEVPDAPTELDLRIPEKDIIDMLDAALKRGIRSQDRANARKILDAQILSMYQRCLNVVNNEVSVGETMLYGLLNINGVKISREDARELVLNHFKRMKVSLQTSGKKRIDSVVQKSVSIEIEEKIIKRDIR